MNTTKNWSDKTILITGASKGLGKELALLLAVQNPNLILVARTYDSLLTLQKTIKNRTRNTPVIVKCDVSKPDEVKNLATFISQKYQKLDVLINNAAIAFHKVSADMEYKEMQEQFETNVYGMFYCVKEMLPLIKLSKSGYILNIGSLVSKIQFADNSLYAATKSAVMAYTKGLRLELKKFDIKVGLFQSGLMNTGFQDDRINWENKIPSFMILNVQKVANKLKKMIEKKKKTITMYEWMVWIMKLKILFK